MWGKGPTPPPTTTTTATNGRASPATVARLAYVPVIPPSSRSHHPHSHHHRPLFFPPTTTDHSYSSFPTSQRWHSTDHQAVNENHRGLRLRSAPLLSSHNNGDQEPDYSTSQNITSSSTTTQRVATPSEPVTVRFFPTTATASEEYGLATTNEKNNGRESLTIEDNVHDEFSPPLYKYLSSDSASTQRDESSCLAAKKKDNIMISSVLLLNLVAIIWGTQHAVIKWVLMDSPAAPFTLLRFALAALVASPYTPGLMVNEASSSSVVADEKVHSSSTSTISPAWRWGAEMGVWMFLGFSFQAIGLEYTTAQRSGFLLYLNVKLVPFFARFLLGRRISKATWISAVSAFSGTALLALDHQSSSSNFGFNVGDVWTIAAAACSAMFILRLETASQKVPQSAQLNAACLWVVTLLAAIWTFAVGSDPSYKVVALSSNRLNDLHYTLAAIVETAKTHPWEVIYLGAVTTALANYIQTRAQKDISPERASVIYSMDPVYGSFFAWLILGETLGGPQAILGASLITIAAATNAFLDFGPTSSSSDDNNNYNIYDNETSDMDD